MFVLNALIFLQAATASDASATQVVQKPKQVCEMLQVTGSRSKRRVCRDEHGKLDLGPAVSNSAFGKAKLQAHGTGSSTSTIGQ